MKRYVSGFVLGIDASCWEPLSRDITTAAGSPRHRQSGLRSHGLKAERGLPTLGPSISLAQATHAMK